MAGLSTLLLVAGLALAGCASSQPEAPPALTPSPSPPASRPSLAAGDNLLTTQWNGRERSYRVHAPPGYDRSTALPLVVTMHFYPGTGEQVARTSGMSAKADAENFLVLYPDALNGGGMNALSCCGAEDDVGLLKVLIDAMIDEWNADPAQIYATGISNGADMAYRLAVELPGTFAAIAAVSGAFAGPATESSDFYPKTPVSVISFIGGRDRHRRAMTAGLDRWRERLGCIPAESPAAGLPNDITAESFSCADGSDVLAYHLPQMGHSWPGGEPGGRLAAPDAGVSATDLMWQFFQQHRR